MCSGARQANFPIYLPGQKRRKNKTENFVLYFGARRFRLQICASRHINPASSTIGIEKRFAPARSKWFVHK
jgi:hypothetical protein